MKYFFLAFTAKSCSLISLTQMGIGDGETKIT
jgi:hypothetical protein